MIKKFVVRVIYHSLRIITKLNEFAKKLLGDKYFYFVLKKGIVTKDILTKEQKQEIDRFYIKNYGKKITYKWHNLFTAYNGNFDVKYIPFDICYSFVKLMNPDKSSYNILQDKNFLYTIAKSANIKVAKRYLYSINGLFFDSENNIISKEEFYKQISNIGEVFIKPTQKNNTGNAKNCRLINVKEGIDINSNTSVKNIIEKYYSNDFVVQEKIVCHESISNLHPKSVNTFCINTIIINNKVKILNSVLQIGMGENTFDWCGFASKGLMLSVNKDGTLHNWAICPNERKKYFSHPDTGIIFRDYKIDLFPKVLEAAKAFHLSIPWLKFCNWGITIDSNGTPVVIEIENPSYMNDQMLLGKGIFDEHTEEILTYLKNKEKY